MATTQVKSPVKSRTLWINGLTLASTVAAFIIDSNLFAEKPAVIASILAVNSVINITLRFATKTEIKKQK